MAPVVKAESAPYKVEPPPVVKVSEPAPVVEPVKVEAVAPAVKKSTITCVKGKLVKKITAVSPKCPAGYKKKA